MDTETLEKLRYPIGRFTPPSLFTEELKNSYIDEIAALPKILCMESGRLER